MFCILILVVNLCFCCKEGLYAGDGGAETAKFLTPTPIEKIEYRNRSKIKECVHDWIERKIPYCQCNPSDPYECCGSCPYCKGSRCDCSGYVSHCWGVEGYSTWTLPKISHSIEKAHLKHGDILLNVAGEHVVIFMGWDGSGEAKYHVAQEAGCHTSYPHHASMEVVPYPMSWGGDNFKPRRFNYVRED